MKELIEINVDSQKRERELVDDHILAYDIDAGVGKDTDDRLDE
jgi:hypothetical protein